MSKESAKINYLFFFREGRGEVIHCFCAGAYKRMRTSIGLSEIGF
jgi:hypothetical protein